MTPPDQVAAGIMPSYQSDQEREAGIQLEAVKLDEMEIQFRRDGETAKKLRLEETHDEALRLVGDSEAPPPNSRREAKLARLDRQAPAQLAALTLQRAKVEKARAANPRARSEYIRAVLDGAATLRRDGYDEVKTILPQMISALERVIAADHVIRRLIGDNFSVPAGAALPTSGLTVIRRFLKALPDQLRPDGFTEECLFAGAHEIASNLVSMVKGSQQ